MNTVSEVIELIETDLKKANSLLEYLRKSQRYADMGHVETEIKVLDKLLSAIKN